MAAQTVIIDPAAPEKAFALCGETIRKGGVIAYPTDTVYGLGADPRNSEAIRRIFAIKGRESDQPILLLLSDARQVADWAESVSPAAERLMARFWPGPLTLVFPARPNVLPQLTAGTGTIGLRVPCSVITQGLLNAVGGALTGTSANRSGGPDPKNTAEVLRELGDRVDLILNGGASIGTVPSTVVDVAAGPPRIIRRGAISEVKLLI